MSDTTTEPVHLYYVEPDADGIGATRCGEPGDRTGRPVCPACTDAVAALVAANAAERDREASGHIVDFAQWITDQPMSFLFGKTPADLLDAFFTQSPRWNLAPKEGS